MVASTGFNPECSFPKLETIDLQSITYNLLQHIKCVIYLQKKVNLIFLLDLGKHSRIFVWKNEDSSRNTSKDCNGRSCDKRGEDQVERKEFDIVLDKR